MKNVQKIDLGLTGYDELFMNDSERQENRLPRIYDIPISEIDDFPDHPFKVKVDEDMDQLVQSIKERGIITPVTLRPKEDGRYEIVSGHRRKKACELAGLDTVKAEVREMTRDEAIILMVESNLQRSTILPSEKAFSYKMRLEAMNRQGQRTDLTCSPLGNKLQGVKSSNVMAEEVGESKNTIFRYIRLTELIPELLTLVDDSRIAFRPAVELSYLKKEEQAALLEEISYTDATPSLAQAIKMKKFSQEGKLSQEVIESIMSEEKPNQKEKINIKYEEARRFIPASVPYMSQLTGKTEQELFENLKGVIFLNPMHTSDEDGRPKYLPADEYLSGNVREKLAIAKRSADLYPDDYGENVRALEAVQPVDLTASEISVRLGATWLPPEIVEQFMFELFSTPRYCQWNIHVHFSQFTGEWNVEGKSYDRGNVKAYNTYGTNRINGYKIMEETLNLKDVRIFDYIEDENGKKTAVLNKKETAIAQGKQELIKQAFADWIWSDPERRESLTKMYNEKFNSVRPREYDGSHMSFVGINPEITLRPHQVNAIAHILYGGNTLLAHVVGAGKTFEMVAAAQESKRLGLCQKSLFVVPNHLTEQWASEYLQLYPSANILVATKKDFETKNRKKFCGRIATGDYDAIIIGHSQFEKIPMSIERQRAILEQQLDEILEGISELKRNRGDNFSIKQLERTKKTVKQKLEKLNDQSRKDDVVTFEELGVDRIFIDEAHYYKNLAAFTKMRNVGGISQTEAMKSSDLYMKCRYLDELTGGRGVVFATGTPISNSMVEMYTMQKYLQYGTLRRNDLIHFDAWASTFGETVTAIELSPEGTGYRAKTRFAKFYNLPELMAMFKETADIQTADTNKYINMI